MAIELSSKLQDEVGNTAVLRYIRETDIKTRSIASIFLFITPSTFGGINIATLCDATSCFSLSRKLVSISDVYLCNIFKWLSDICQTDYPGDRRPKQTAENVPQFGIVKRCFLTSLLLTLQPAWLILTCCQLPTLHNITEYVTSADVFDLICWHTLSYNCLMSYKYIRRDMFLL